MSLTESEVETALANAKPNTPEVFNAPAPKANLAVAERSPIPVGPNGALQIRNSEDITRVAALLWKSGAVPRGAKSAEQLAVCLIFGMERGLSTMESARQTMCINGAPCLWGDAPLGMVMRTGKLSDIAVERKFEGKDSDGVTVTVKRKGMDSPASATFTVGMAKKAGLWGKSGPWSNMPERMLELRARAFALRNLFPDVLMGNTAEELEGVEDDAAKLNASIDSLNALGDARGGTDAGSVNG